MTDKIVRRGGPALTLTQEILEEIVGCVALGNFRYVARGRAGVSESSFKSWLSRGRAELRELEEGKRDDLTLKADLVVALDQAENEVHSKIVEDVLGSNDNKLKLDYLYRRYSKLYAKNSHAVDDYTGETVKIDPFELLAEKLTAFIKE